MTVVLGWGFESSPHNTCSTYSCPGQTPWLSVLTDQGTVVFIYMICCLLLSCSAVVLRPFHQHQTSQIGFIYFIFFYYLRTTQRDISHVSGEYGSGSFYKGRFKPCMAFEQNIMSIAQTTPGQLVLITGATQIGCRCLNWEVQKPGVMTNTSTGTWSSV